MGGKGRGWQVIGLIIENETPPYSIKEWLMDN